MVKMVVIKPRFERLTQPDRSDHESDSTRCSERDGLSFQWHESCVGGLVEARELCLRPRVARIDCERCLQCPARLEAPAEQP
jgi:hypothetical protein